MPDGKLKKKLKDKKDIYRLRVGDFRVFYTFGDTWVRLLGIRRRDERTYSDGLADIQPDQPQAGAETVDIDVDTLDVEEAPRPEFHLTAPVKSTPLPRRITAEWLHGLQIPAAYIPILVSCESEEALFGATVPTTVLERVLDNLLPLPLAEVEQQPDLVVRDTNDLVRYKEGGLVSFLLKLDADQQHLTQWALKGPTMVKGGAGTGKSTVALYRAKALLEAATARGDARLLFTTYTRALIAASQQLLGQLLTPEQMERVRVASCDEMAREIVARTRRVGRMETGGTALQVLHTVRQCFQPSGPSAFDRRLRAKALQALSDRYLLEEFDWILDGRGLVEFPQYLDALRPGRGCALRPGLREGVWELHGAFKQEMVCQGIGRWADLRSEALRLVQAGHWSQRFDYVIVDEAQDLTPTSLCLMAELARSPDGLFFAADSKQSLYSRNYTWTSAHPRLQFQGRTRTLTRNYRSTVEIDRAAFDVLMPEADDVVEPSTSIHSGPMPVLVTGVPTG